MSEVGLSCMHSSKSTNHLQGRHESTGRRLIGQVLFPCLVDKHHHLISGKGKIISSQKSLSRNLITISSKSNMKALLPLTTGIIWEGKKFDQSRNTPLKKPTTGFKAKRTENQ